ncbi:ComEA family DNA-binding protein [Actinomadura craniellae]|uniref:ComEA family DNA-binding protein n=1 Tax=Actinomadura craniellae TaxID=2231787 RepID=A0A365GZ55_9ACTN|nr:ComEA family DNA-binding protein [Actinomadura craniellae]
MAALAAGCLLWSSRPRPQPVQEVTVRPSPAAVGAAVPSPPGPAGAAGPDPGSGTRVVVHVAGKVRRPGIVTLRAGARVSEAVTAAGGPRPGASLDTLNLARRVVDGEQIVVGARGMAPPAPAGAAPPGGASPPGAVLDLNSATAGQLQELPGVGPVLAQRIVDHRTRSGGFRSVEELREVSGIGERRYAELRERVRV